VAGGAAGATLGSADGAAAGWSSPREHPVSIGEVDNRTAAARINGSARPFGLVSNFIIFLLLLVERRTANPEAHVPDGQGY
jgi:hypothetical protein